MAIVGQAKYTRARETSRKFRVASARNFATSCSSDRQISCREEGVSRTDRLIIVKSVVAKVYLVQIAQLS